MVYLDFIQRDPRSDQRTANAHLRDPIEMKQVVARENASSSDDYVGPESVQRQSPGWRIQALIVVVVALIAVAAAGAYLGLRKPAYEATANVLETPLQNSDPSLDTLPLIRESSDGSRPVQTAAGLFSSVDIDVATARALGKGWTPARVSSDVQVVPRGESDIVAITATGSTASLAASIANDYANAGLRLRRLTLEPFVQAAIRDLSGLSQPGARSARSSATGGATLSSGLPVSYERNRLQTVARLGDPTLSVAAAAVPPTSSNAKSAALILGVALIAGLMLGFGVAAVRAAIKDDIPV
jgi:hypothetical protein